MANKNELSDFDISEVNQKDDSMEVLDSNNIDDEIVIEEEVRKLGTKNEQAKELMQNSSEIISEVDSDVRVIRESIYEDTSIFEDAKSTLLNTTITQSQSLLNKVSYDYANIEQEEPFEISLGTKGKNVKVEDVKSGAFSGFLLAIISMFAIVGAWIYFATQKLGIALTPELITNQESQLSIFKLIGGMTGSDVDPSFGMIIVGVTSLLVGWIVYKFRVSTKENKNLRVANETFEKSNIYVEHQKEAKTDMERIERHIVEVIPVIEDYRVLLDEQNAKLQRVLHVEGIKEDSGEYHSSSIDSMKETDLLMERVEALVSTPITKDGKLNDASVVALSEAKSVSEYFVSKIYS